MRSETRILHLRVEDELGWSPCREQGCFLNSHNGGADLRPFPKQFLTAETQRRRVGGTSSASPTLSSSRLGHAKIIAIVSWMTPPGHEDPRWRDAIALGSCNREIFHRYHHAPPSDTQSRQASEFDKISVLFEWAHIDFIRSTPWWVGETIQRLKSK